MERFLEVPISDEEFFDRCKPWKGSLMVIVLEKRIGFHHLEAKLNRDWQGRGL